jgi:hypothetical protein
MFNKKITLHREKKKKRQFTVQYFLNFPQTLNLIFNPKKKEKKKTQSLKILRGKKTESERLRSGCASTVNPLSIGSSTTSSNKHSSQ